jgi:hypothetical protein
MSDPVTAPGHSAKRDHPVSICFIGKDFSVQ